MLYLFDHIVHIFISFVQNFEIILQDTVTRLIFSAFCTQLDQQRLYYLNQ